MDARKYTEQYQRMRRYLERVRRISFGMPHTQESLSYDDDVYSFFQNCFHLKDWIRNDPYCQGWPNVDDHVNSSRDLRLCADLCNGMKHLTLNRHRSGEEPTFAGGKRTISLVLGSGADEKASIAMLYTILNNQGQAFDAFELATNCVAAWDQFISANDPTLGQ